MLRTPLSLQENGRKHAVFVRPKEISPQSHVAVLIWRIAMKLLKVLSIAAVLLFAVSAASAQNNLSNPNDSACWQSLEALHSCAQAQYDREMAQAERCTSYPEYQCEPESQPIQNVHVAKMQKQKKSKVASVSTPQSHQTTSNSSGGEAVVIDLNPANSLR
jgi:hypothetical protein